MINLRTIVLGASTFVQGVLVKRHGARNFHTGQFEPNGNATVRVGFVEHTGQLIPSLRKGSSPND